MVMNLQGTLEEIAQQILKAAGEQRESPSRSARATIVFEEPLPTPAQSDSTSPEAFERALRDIQETDSVSAPSADYSLEAMYGHPGEK